MPKHLKEDEDRPLVKITVRLDVGRAMTTFTAPAKYRHFVEKTVLVTEVYGTDGLLQERQVKDYYA